MTHLPVDERVVLLATRSSHKIREIREILGARSRVQLLSLDQAGLVETADERDIECHDTFVGNALAKAHHFAALSGFPTLADDSGLCVDALNGLPGVRSRRFSGRDDLDGQALDQANNAALLARLADVPPERRTARYVCAAVFVGSARPPAVAIGTVSGRIIDAARGDGGFGYDPHFVVEGTDRTFGELGPDEKHARSHRGRAFRALASMIRDPDGRSAGTKG